MTAYSAIDAVRAKWWMRCPSLCSRMVPPGSVPGGSARIVELRLLDPHRLVVVVEDGRFDLAHRWLPSCWLDYAATLRDNEAPVNSRGSKSVAASTAVESRSAPVDGPPG